MPTIIILRIKAEGDKHWPDLHFFIEIFASYADLSFSKPVMRLIIYDTIEIFMYLLGRGFKLKKTKQSYLGK